MKVIDFINAFSTFPENADVVVYGDYNGDGWIYITVDGKEYDFYSEYPDKNLNTFIPVISIKEL